MIFALLLVSLLELSIWLPFIWRVHQYLAAILAPVVVIISGLLLLGYPSVWSGLILIISLYRAFNLARLARGRTNEVYIRRVTLQTSALLIAGLLAIWLGWQSFSYMAPASSFVLAAVAVLQLVGVLVLLFSTIYHLRAGRLQKIGRTYADKDLPTLTVAIPARNETDSLEKCLTSIIRNDYPKLEVMVLDDCSQNKRTPEIIRGFAHDGVQFIQGLPAEEAWLPKNQAYQRLLEEANGELVLFCGVDVRFDSGSLRSIVEALLANDKSMMSILPRNEPPQWRQITSMLIQPMRYAWEIAVPRNSFRRPPVLSTCWIARRDFLHKNGGFAAVTRSISPESYFARAAFGNNRYSFIISDDTMPVESTKSVDEQKDTAIRTRYPQLHKRPEQVCLITLAQLLFLIAPFIIFGLALYHSNLLVAGFTGVASLLLIIIYLQIATLTYRKFLLAGLFVLPFAALANIILLHYSMWKYEFSAVEWKGHNICIPVMRVYPGLPKLQN